MKSIFRGGIPLALWFAFGTILPGPASFSQSPPAATPAQTMDEVLRRLDALQKKYDELRQRMDAMTGAAAGNASVPAPPAEAVNPPPVVAEAPPVAAPASAGASKVFNPDIAMIGNFVGFGGRHSAMLGPAPRSFELTESELSLQAVIDPYARADFFVSFGEQGVEIEEGFATFTKLPAGLTAKIGKFRPYYGKVNTLHSHVLPWVDRPLSFNLYTGGEEGIKDSGISVGWLLPTSTIFTEATVQILRGDNAVFSPFERRDLAYLGHMRFYGDISDAQNLEVGLSAVHGNGDPLAHAPISRYGADLTWRWRPVRTGNYHQLVVRNEWFGADRLAADPRLPALDHRLPFGTFISADYKVAQRWWVGGRYDYAVHPDNVNLQDRQGALTLSFFPSEFQVLRFEARRTWNDLLHRYEDAGLLQLNFAIGAHGAHPF